VFTADLVEEKRVVKAFKRDLAGECIVFG